MIRNIFTNIPRSRSPHWALLASVLATGCGAPVPQIDDDPPQLFTMTKRTRVDATGTLPPGATNYTRRVLFIGNSYTEAGDLPGLVQQLARSSGRDDMQIERNLQGGGTLQIHYTRPGVLEAIRDGHFTHVVLQGRSLEVMDEPDKFSAYAARFASAIHESGAMPVFFETWARLDGDPVYAMDGYGGDLHGMQRIIRDAYQRAAAEGHGFYAPVGDAWERVLGEPAPPDLYGPDIGHPAPAGTYLAACVLYDLLMNRVSAGNPIQGGLGDPATIRRLQRAADATVLGE